MMVDFTSSPSLIEMHPDGERFVPGGGRDCRALHAHRYLAALNLVGGKDVLDLAEGKGSGAWFLAQAARTVTGVDVSARPAVPARARHGRPNLRYLDADGRALPLADHSVDVVTSFEVRQGARDAVLSEIRRVLRPGGLLLMSMPQMASLQAARDTCDPRPAAPMAREAFSRLLRAHFSHVALYDQGLTQASIIWPAPGEAVLGEIAPAPWLQARAPGVLRTDHMSEPVSVIAVASDGPLEGIGGIFQALAAEDAIKAGPRKPVEQIPPAWQAERREFQDEVVRLSRLVQQQQEQINAFQVEQMQSKLGWLQRKRQFYQMILQSGVPVRDTFARRARQKIEKYDSALAGAQALQRTLAMSLDDKRFLVRKGHSQVVAPGNPEPAVSVVIPVFNQVEYTLGCLYSLALHDTAHGFEVIVVDDCSSDATQEELSAVSWIRYIRQPRNQGFIASCNTGLAAARGHHVVFLNNDTEVLPGWLDELVRTFETFPDVGLVGSKLLYPDGTLQEAGGILWKDGSAWNYGRNQDPDRPEFSYARKVDYCSGASIMAPRELLEQLGGFDAHFAPAYCEDSDLAMRVRAAGRDVIFQPLSKVVHFEGVTSGTDTGGGVKAYQVVNSKKLFERWKDALASRPENGENPSDAKDLGLGKRLLVIDAITPEPDRDAGSVTSMEIMRAAQRLGYQITFIPETNLADIPRYTADLQRCGIEAIYGPYCAGVSDHLKEYGSRYDVILVYRVDILWRWFGEIKRHAPNARIVYQTSDLHHLRAARQAELTGDPKVTAYAEQTKAQELELVAKCDSTIVHSTFEKDYLQSLVPGARVEVFNWILDPVGTEVGFAARSGMMFLGGYRHTPNVDAVHYFLDEIWPLIEPRLPAAKFYVVGSNLPDELASRASSSVEMVGFVPDLQPLMDRCRLSVVPLRFGAGTKGKLAMSLAYGLPAVTTSIGGEGMGLVDGDAIFLADDPRDFADRVVELHENEQVWARMSQAGIGYVAENLSRTHGTEIVRRALEPEPVRRNQPEPVARAPEPDPIR